MGKLVANSPFRGVLPVEVGGVTATEVDLGQMTTIAPYPGQVQAVSDQLALVHGLRWPAPNRVLLNESVTLAWFGREMALLTGVAPHAGLTKYAAICDQSDAWSTICLEGVEVRAVLARLCPLDLRASRFAVGHTARTEVAHMMSAVTCLSETQFQVMVFRSFADTVLREITHAMEGVAARRKA